MTGIAYDPTTGVLDVQEQSLDRWKSYLAKNKKHGMSMAKSGLSNEDLLHTIFAGRSAHGVGGCFSPAMAKSQSFLSSDVNDLIDNICQLSLQVF
ncbi:hypothetical protein M5689_013011 [Euphorbia peplus]|nr:hypothetical protein M5689_013011 [Euphorbia peplus]